MYESLIARLQQLARRAGLREVPPAVLLVGCMAAVAVVVWALWHWWPQSASGEALYQSEIAGAKAQVEGDTSAATTSSAVGTPDAAEQVRVMVHVVGSVRHPGVYELVAESRVIDAVDAAGGTLPDAVLSAINMARVVADGEQILVPDEDDPAQTSAGGGGGGGGSPAGTAGGQPAPVDLNTADAAALETLPGVGPATSAKIIADREANGPYARVEDLGRVSGIGPKKLEQLKGMACVR